MTPTARMYFWRWPGFGLTCGRAAIPPALFPFTYFNAIKTTILMLCTKHFPSKTI